MCRSACEPLKSDAYAIPDRDGVLEARSEAVEELSARGEGPCLGVAFVEAERDVIDAGVAPHDTTDRERRFHQSCIRRRP